MHTSVMDISGHLRSALCIAQPLAEQYKFIVVAPECANPAKYVSWVVVDASTTGLSGYAARAGAHTLQRWGIKAICND